MALNIQDLKKAREIITDGFGLSVSDAARVVGALNAAGRVNDLRAVLGGDLSSVPGVLSDLGITAAGAASSAASVGVSGGSVAAPGSASDKIPAAKHKAVTGQNKGDSSEAGDPSGVRPIAGGLRRNFPTRENIKAVFAQTAAEAEIVTDSDELPSGFADSVQEWLEDFANKYGFDLFKLHPQQWRAACMWVGEYIKKSGVIRDRERERHEGGRIYSGKKLEELLQVWAYFCGVLRQVPLVSDFINFTGCHRNFFYDYDGQGLTSAAVRIIQKARAIEAGGLSSSVAGGGAGVIGGIFLLKARHGYSETVTVNHVSSTHDNTASALPVFGDNGLCLEDSEKNVDNSP